ncbi:MAG: hypothetical protein GY732_14100 [Gammaproteobacteria bacterium]|nr:hypothetical protein [Gammaproteobacteria bacterium]
MKSIILMTTAIFLLSAPFPDSETISEISAGFLLIPSEKALAAAEVTPKVPLESEPATVLPVESEKQTDQDLP